MVLSLLLPIATAYYTQNYIDSANWMSQQMTTLESRRLIDITLPGTHDAGSYDLGSDLMPDSESDMIETITKIAESLGIGVTGAIHDWAETQTVRVYDQLVDGIRYVDLRSGWYDGDWVTYHFQIGDKIKDILSDINLFLDLHPGELIILELSHFDGDPSHDDIRALEHLVLNTFGQKLIQQDYNFEGTIYNYMQEGQRILVAMEKTYLGSSQIWSNDYIHNSYADTSDCDDMIDYNKDQVEDFISGKQAGKLYKISWTLTPDTDTVLRSILPDTPNSLKEMADDCNDNLGDFWNDMIKKKYRIGNIIIADHFETAPVLSVAMQINKYLEYV